MEFYKLQVKNIVKETPDTVSIYFDLSNEQRSHFSFSAGQYITIKAEIDGNEIRRSYSLSNGIQEKELRIAVKRVTDGLMSNFLIDNVKIGDILEVSQPDGKFSLTPSEEIRSHYFICAGSGITPIMSMINTVLTEEPQSVCYLLYGSRDENNIIYKKELDDLLKYHEGQLVVVHSLSKPLIEKKKGLGGLFSKGKINWDGEVGRIDRDKITIFMRKNPGNKNNFFYLCGPGNLIDMAKSKLSQDGIDDSRVHSEYFSSGSAPVNTNMGIASGKIIVTIKGKTHEMDVVEGKSILDTMIDAKLDPPYSCTSGACSTCVAKIQRGTAEMHVCYALDEDEINEGLILTCQAVPTSEVLDVNFDV